MPIPRDLIRQARRRAGLTQGELARRAGTSQPAIARLESGAASPTLATLERVLRAAGFQLQCDLEPVAGAAGPDAVIEAYMRDVDRSLLRANLRRTVEQRLRMNAEAVAAGRELARAVAAVRRPA